MRLSCLLLLAALSQLCAQKVDYRVLATNRTSTMEKEMNDAAEAGFVFSSVMGGETGMGGKEVVTVMAKSADGSTGKRRYKLLATSRTGTMQKELQEAGAEGFSYCGQTVFQSAFGGREVAVILEKNLDGAPQRIEYLLLATKRTSTMQKELQQAGDSGFRLLGMVVGKTAIGGDEVISILQRVK
ncbi:MAG: hypothetical protein JST93_33565 [Acidobacteria bacterium]|nr:hypothetical protein [Acidobacteriota bacterium]